MLSCGLLLAASGVGAQIKQGSQRPSPFQLEVLRTKLNESTLILAASHPNASYLAMAHDIAAALGTSDDLRVLAVSGDGGIENLRDLLLLRGVDVAVVPANALAHARATESLGAGLPQRIAYIGRLYSEEVHLLVGRNTQSLEELRGKKVGVLAEDGKTQFTAADLFQRFGIEIEAVQVPPGDVIERVRSGELAGALLIGGKPLPLVSSAPKDGSVRLLGLPFSRAFEEGYSPATFRSEDYPALIPTDLVVETVAVSAVLVAKTSRSQDESSPRVAKFVSALFDAIAEQSLRRRHVKWREVNLAATLPGWPRLAAAEQWLSRAQQEQATSLQKEFHEFVRRTRPAGSPKLTPAQEKKMFDEFVIWTRNSVRDTDKTSRK